MPNESEPIKSIDFSEQRKEKKSVSVERKREKCELKNRKNYVPNVYASPLPHVELRKSGIVSHRKAGK
jgi:hypothetical protein